MAELVLISGGSGMIGQALARHLSAAGYEVNFLSRSITHKDNPKEWYWNVEKGEMEKYISNDESTSPSLGALIREEIERQGGELLPKKED